MSTPWSSQPKQSVPAATVNVGKGMNTRRCPRCTAMVHAAIKAVVESPVPVPPNRATDTIITPETTCSTVSPVEVPTNAAPPTPAKVNMFDAAAAAAASASSAANCACNDELCVAAASAATFTAKASVASRAATTSTRTPSTVFFRSVLTTPSASTDAANCSYDIKPPRFQLIMLPSMPGARCSPKGSPHHAYQLEHVLSEHVVCQMVPYQ
ncbi:hypothetical protein D3C72_1353440 [compost metagenome]